MLDGSGIIHPLAPLFTWEKAEHDELSVGDLDKVKPFIQEFSLLSSMEQLYGELASLDLGDSIKNWQAGLARTCTEC